MSSTASFYAHGKLLLSGEYFVLAGARALAVPLRLGQHLEIHAGEEPGVLSWESLDEQGNVWLTARFSLPDFSLLDEEHTPERKKLQNVFRVITVLKGERIWLSPNDALLLRTRLEFPRAWGLGSSSTLLSCLSRWAEVDVYQLAEATFGGSGYDLAAAEASGPIFFRRLSSGLRGSRDVEISPAPFHPPFREQLYFIYLGRKQDSREGIRRFGAYSERFDLRLLHRISELSTAFSICRKAGDFQRLMLEHENLVAEALSLTPVQQQRFDDFSGTVKSLGAWGGDFALVCSEESEAYVRSYFNQKGVEVLLTYDELILK